MPTENARHPSSPYVLCGQTRDCFTPIHLPLLAQVYLHIYEGRWKGIWGWLCGAIQRRLFRRLMHLLVIPAQGRFSYRLGDQVRAIEFNARNTQFHSVYSPKHMAGYEPETSLLIDACLPENGILWDVGSNWGHFSLYACSRPGFKGHVHAFEPMPKTFEDLRQTVEQAGLHQRVYCHNYALGDTDGTSTASLPDGVHSGTATLTQVATGTEVQVHAADHLDLPDPDVIKIDVEGFEAAVLQGAQSIIRRACPMIIMESWLEAPEKTLVPLRLLEELGYQLFHPVWFIENSGGTYYDTHQASASSAAGQHQLTLLPFASIERSLRCQYMNLFACHVSKLPKLQAMLDKRQFPEGDGATSSQVPCL